MILFAISLMLFSYFVSVHANHTQSFSAIFLRGCLEPSFHTPQSAEGALRSTSSREQS